MNANRRYLYSPIFTFSVMNAHKIDNRPEMNEKNTNLTEKNVY